MPKSRNLHFSRPQLRQMGKLRVRIFLKMRPLPSEGSQLTNLIAMNMLIATINDSIPMTAVFLPHERHRSKNFLKIINDSSEFLIPPVLPLLLHRRCCHYMNLKLTHFKLLLQTLPWNTALLFLVRVFQDIDKISSPQVLRFKQSIKVILLLL